MAVQPVDLGGDQSPGAHKVGLATDPADAAVGVSQNKPQVLGEATTVATHGISMVQAGAALAAGLPVTTDSDGRALGLGTGDATYGITVGSSGAADELIPVLLRLN